MSELISNVPISLLSNKEINTFRTPNLHSFLIQPLLLAFFAFTWLAPSTLWNSLKVASSCISHADVFSPGFYNRLQMANLATMARHVSSISSEGDIKGDILATIASFTRQIDDRLTKIDNSQTKIVHTVNKCFNTIDENFSTAQSCFNMINDRLTNIDNRQSEIVHAVNKHFNTINEYFITAQSWFNMIDNH
ncbi:hypothetical protein HOY82DRAFT_543683 [Tuber indicum]|nr:hypothetical protein HOY82DRAFT_543683 [Tuber indicum]